MNNRFQLRNMPEMIKNIVIINVLVFLATWVFPRAVDINLYDILGLNYIGLPFPTFNPIQFITHMFMHAGIAHIAFNMIALISIGHILERVWGGKRFLFFYISCGVGAGLIHELISVYQVYQIFGEITVPGFNASAQKTKLIVEGIAPIVVGASGAVYGVLAAFALLFPHTELVIFPLPFPVKAKYAVFGLMLIGLFMGVANFKWDNIAHFAHLGGALVGFVIVKIWSRNRDILY